METTVTTQENPNCKDKYKPNILGFLCHFCAYSAADLAGASRLEYPSNLKVIRVMCTGRVDPEITLRALTQGFDGILICGCHPGDCHFISGNCNMLGRFKLIEKMLSSFGIEPERLRLEWIAASESERYAQVVRDMTECIQNLGPLDWSPPGSEKSEQIDGGKESID